MMTNRSCWATATRIGKSGLPMYEIYKQIIAAVIGTTNSLLKTLKRNEEGDF
jgi:hypothetical protein